jgi:hypothetical protein
VFVIETKNMKGWIFGGARQQMWTQKIFKYTKKFKNPFRQNCKHVGTLKSLLELNDQQIFSVVVFVGSSTFKTELPENVIKGPGLIKYIKSKEQQVILRTDVPMILSKIEAERTIPSKETTKRHIKHVKEMMEEKRNGNHCLKCGSPMVMRVTKNGTNRGQNFFGCSKFPECSEILSIPIEDEVVEVESMDETMFSDSWGNKTWHDDEIQPARADRAFR